MRSTRVAAVAIAAFVLVSAAAIVPLPYFLERPGNALGLGERIMITAPSAEPIDGDFLLVTVTLQRTTLADLLSAWLSPTLEVVGVDQVIPPGQTGEEFFAHQQEIFEQSARRAAAVGLTAAGFEVGPEDVGGEGALVVSVVPDSAADGALLPGDVIVAVDGDPIATDDDLREAIPPRCVDSIEALPPSSCWEPGSLRLAVRRAGQATEIDVRPQPVSGEPARPVIGVEVTTLNASIDLPVPFDVDSSNIGGPSAGLMIALAVFDTMDPLDLADGRLIAGTGTIHLDGTVGLISGIRQKVAAAHREGVDLFLSPQGQLAEAQRGVPTGSDLRVIGVATFDEAVASLRDHD
ncbi:MAG: YlbL family protein [Egibacteraceae bacterium]